MKRIIALMDLDYFFAQCEMLRNPELKGSPVVIVMQTVRENTGAVATCNYEARKLKILSGMSKTLAKKLADDKTFFIKADKEYYKEISDKVFEILDKFSDKVEQVSIDEAYFDLTNFSSMEKAKEECVKIKNRIFSELGLTCSIGIGSSKLIAKMSSNENKPNGLTVVEEGDEERFLDEKGVSELHGLGPKSKKILEEKNIKKIKDLKILEKSELIKMFGRAKGEQFYNFARGIDNREINTNREKKQISRLMTIKKDTLDFEEIKKTTDFLSERVFKETKELNKNFKTASLILINKKYETITKSKTPDIEIRDIEELKNIINDLLKEALGETLIEIRRVGVRVSNFGSDYGYQKKLFDFGG
jgi:DNA polymerase IV (DinB-like DNA polymerase)